MRSVPGCVYQFLTDIDFMPSPDLHTVLSNYHLSGLFNSSENVSFTCIYLFGGLHHFQHCKVISRWVVGRAGETSTYSNSGFCIVNCRPTASNYQLSHLRPCLEPNPGLRGERRECYHSAAMAPLDAYKQR